MNNPRADLPTDNSDCRVLAPFVMTLFDGEADELEARRARAHLLVCQTCANRWLDWNRSRDLLQSAPVPAPPPQLLWRVLMACRLHRAPKRVPQRAASQARDSDAMAPDFTARILARTTRPDFFGFASRPAFSWPRASTLAVPALAIWMMVLQRDTWMPAPTAGPEPAPVALFEVSSRARTSPNAIFKIARNRSAAPAIPVARLLNGRASNSSRLAANTAKSAPEVNQTFEPLASTAPRRAVPNNFARLRSAPSNREGDGAPAESNAPERASTRVISVASPRAAFTMGEGAPRGGATRPEHGETPRAARALRGAEPVLLAKWSGHRAPHLRAARWQKATWRAPQNSENGAGDEDFESSAAAPQALRVSLPSARTMQTGQASARLLAENFESDDERVEEIRSVVDDFRATLDPDGANNDTSATDDGIEANG